MTSRGLLAGGTVILGGDIERGGRFVLGPPSPSQRGVWTARDSQAGSTSGVVTVHDPYQMVPGCTSGRERPGSAQAELSIIRTTPDRQTRPHPAISGGRDNAHRAAAGSPEGAENASQQVRGCAAPMPPAHSRVPKMQPDQARRSFRHPQDLPALRQTIQASELGFCWRPRQDSNLRHTV